MFREERIKAMRLYEHSARCRAALLTFLSGNPHYWCFIPQPWNDSMTVNFDCMGEPAARDSEVNYLVEQGVIQHRRVASFLRRVPLPPARYIFSYQQRQEQRIFFRNMVSGVYGVVPYTLLNLYQFKTVAVRKSSFSFPSIIITRYLCFYLVPNPHST